LRITYLGIDYCVYLYYRNYLLFSFIYFYLVYLSELLIFISFYFYLYLLLYF